jgi:hypothetical protein
MGVIHNNKDGTYTNYEDDDYEDSLENGVLCIRNIFRTFCGKENIPLVKKKEVIEKEKREQALLDEIKKLRKAIQNGKK